MTHGKVVTYLVRRAYDRQRAPKDRVNDINRAFRLINEINSDPDASPQDRARASSIKEEISRRLRVGHVTQALQEPVADEGTPAEIREEIWERLVQLEQQSKVRGAGSHTMAAMVHPLADQLKEVGVSSGPAAVYSAPNKSTGKVGRSLHSAAD